MRPPQSTLAAAQVQQPFRHWLAPVLGPWPAVRRCTAAAVTAALACAAHRLSAVADACARLAGAPDGDTALGLLARLLPHPDPLERRLQAALAGRLPRAVRRGRWAVAVDITLVPDHGRPFRDPAEVDRSQPKGGTSHSPAYATASPEQGIAPCALRYAPPGPLTFKASASRANARTPGVLRE
jgi:hypothetical protein